MNPVLENLPRNVRRALLAKEAIARRTGNWGAWEIIRFPRGSVGKTWAADFTCAHKNAVFSVLDRTLPNGIRHLAIASLSQVRPTWPEMQRIKDELAGPMATAVEVYPPHAEIVDDADMYCCRAAVHDQRAESSMTLRRHIARVLSWWNRAHPSRALERAIPAFAEAARRERRARARNDARGIGAARRAKREALHADLAGGRR